ncbi:MAG: multiprotein-bridging factor 1 family protein [archaeon]
MVILCEICGSRPARGRHSVEGAILSVCEQCGKFGAPVRDVFLKRQRGAAPAVGDGEPEVAPNYAEIIRKGRERAGLTQKELAAKSLERESVVAKIEQGEFIPSIPTAKKLEKVLGVRLIGGSNGEETKVSSPEKSERMAAPAGMTFGDLINKRRKGE